MLGKLWGIWSCRCAIWKNRLGCWTRRLGSSTHRNIATFLYYYRSNFHHVWKQCQVGDEETFCGRKHNRWQNIWGGESFQRLSYDWPKLYTSFSNRVKARAFNNGLIINRFLLEAKTKFECLCCRYYFWVQDLRRLMTYLLVASLVVAGISVDGWQIWYWLEQVDVLVEDGWHNTMRGFQGFLKYRSPD